MSLRVVQIQVGPAEQCGFSLSVGPLWLILSWELCFMEELGDIE